MSLPVGFHRLANLELQEGSAYYSTVGDGLGEEFIDEVERAMRILAEHPAADPVVRRGVRKLVLRQLAMGLAG